VTVKRRKLMGLSLAEILATILLLGVGLIAVVGVFPFGLAHIRIIGDRAFVVQQAQAKMEALKNMSYDTMYEMYVTKKTVIEDPLRDINGKAFPYSLTANFTENYFNEDGEKLIRIRLEIRWFEDNPYGMAADDSAVANKVYVLEGYKGQGAVKQ